MSYPKIIAAISNELQRRYGNPGKQSPQPDAVVGKILASQAAMPDFLRLAMQLLTWGFDYSGLFTAGSRFRSMSPDMQSRQLDAWKNSRFDVCRNFTRFYESLYLLIVMEEDVR